MSRILQRPPLDLGTDAASQASALARGCSRVLPQGGLKEKLAEGRPLRIKLGLDPTAPDLHLGHSIVLQRLREFQDAGHEVILIIGDFTARIGDPSGRSATRPMLSEDEINGAAEGFAAQASNVLDLEHTEIRRNSEWLDMSMTELLNLTRVVTVAQIIEREDFAKRLREGSPISMLELLYPLVQGFDSVAIKADVELGGTDQTFNLLLARDIQRHFGLPEQVCLTLPILTGTDGKAKMAKSVGNHIGLGESAEEIFGKTMSIPDEAMAEWLDLLFGAHIGEEDDVFGDPLAQKRLLARSLAERFAGAGEGARAEASFDSLFRRGETPEDIEKFQLPKELVEDGAVHLPALLAEAFSISRNQARRELAGGAVKIEGQKQAPGELNVSLEGLIGKTLQLGKRRFVRVEQA